VSAATPNPSKFAAYIIAFLTISPFLVALDLALHFLPTFPAIQTMRMAPFIAKAMWLSLGPLGIATTFLLLRRPVVGLVLCVVFSAISAVAGFMLWQQVRPLGLLSLLLACVLAALGARQARSNNSFKPKPLRGSA